MKTIKKKERKTDQMNRWKWQNKQNRAVMVMVLLSYVVVEKREAQWISSQKWL